MNSIIINFDNSADINAAFKQLKKQYPKNRITKAVVDVEQLEDEYLLAIAEERIKNDTGARYSLDDIIAELGIMQEEIDETEADFE